MYGANLATIPPGVDGRVALEEVRRRVAGADGPAPDSAEAAEAYLRSDHMLVRFLIARQWDVDKACQMLKEHYRWLSETKMSTLLKDPWPEEATIKKYYPQTYHGVDKLGRPIYIERPGKIDMAKLMQSVSHQRLLHYMACGSELQIRRRLPACSIVRGHVVDKSLAIMDLDGLGFRAVSHSTARKVVKDFVGILQSHYPEVAGKTVIINAPTVFSVAWSFVKPMLDEKTVGKISIYGTDKRAYSEALLELVDADQLPALFGGTCADADQLQTQKGPWTDPSIQAILETEPLEYVMTPEGAASLHRRWRGINGDAAAVDDTAPAAAEVSPAGAVAPATAGVAEAVPEAAPEDEAEEGGDVGDLPESHPEAAEIRRLEMEASLLEEEYRQREETHKATITTWLDEYNRLMEEIGRHVIERSQPFYDSLSLWQQAVQDYASQQTELDDIGVELERAVRSLSRVEAALCGQAELSEEEWAQLAPLPEEEGGEAAPGASLLAQEGGMDGRLIHALRMSVLADRVAALQRRRDAAKADLAARSREVGDRKTRYDEEAEAHSSSRSSVKRAAPYHEKRRFHEIKVETQRAELRALERRLQQTRQALAELQGPGTAPTLTLAGRTRSRQLDEMSLQSFEIPAGAPAEDEWHSCGSFSDLGADGFSDAGADDGNI